MQVSDVDRLRVYKDKLPLADWRNWASLDGAKCPVCGQSCRAQFVGWEAGAIVSGASFTLPYGHVVRLDRA